jgi:hypothetical protein
VVYEIAPFMTISPPRTPSFPAGGRKAEFVDKLDGIGWKIGGVHEILNWMELEV